MNFYLEVREKGTKTVVHRVNVSDKTEKERIVEFEKLDSKTNESKYEVELVETTEVLGNM